MACAAGVGVGAPQLACASGVGVGILSWRALQALFGGYASRAPSLAPPGWRGCRLWHSIAEAAVSGRRMRRLRRMLHAQRCARFIFTCGYAFVDGVPPFAGSACALISCHKRQPPYPFAINGRLRIGIRRGDATRGHVPHPLAARGRFRVRYPRMTGFAFRAASDKLCLLSPQAADFAYRVANDKLRALRLQAADSALRTASGWLGTPRLGRRVLCRNSRLPQCGRRLATQEDVGVRGASCFLAYPRRMRASSTPVSAASPSAPAPSAASVPVPAR